MERRSFLKGIAAAVGASVVNPSYAGNLIGGHSEGDVWQMKEAEVLSSFDILFYLGKVTDSEVKVDVESSYNELDGTATNVVKFGKNTLVEKISFETRNNLAYLPRCSELFMNGEKLGAKEYILDESFVIGYYSFESESAPKALKTVPVQLSRNCYMLSKYALLKSQFNLNAFAKNFFTTGPIPAKMSGIVTKLN
ncbi:MAG TPA: twin-arginine translocation signal domain-containing protein [Acidobacteriota bacterium]|nr:twin-arginine translocation signal domain-containing protein [Acidobacteriota bacterium]